MYYLLKGDKRKELKDKSDSILESALKKRGDANVIKVDAFENAHLIKIAIETKGLFEDKSIVIIDASADKDLLNFLEESSTELQNSESLFIIYLGETTKADSKKLLKNANKIEEKNETKTAKKETNIFSITDYFLKRDKKQCWKTYIGLLKDGFRAEEIHGILFWQMRVISAVSQASQAESKLKPFVYKKTKQHIDRWDKGEIEKNFIELINIWNKAHNTGGDLEISLEKYIIKI